MKKVLAALAASGVLVAGAFTAAAISDTGVATAQDVTDEGALVDEAPQRPGHGAHLGTLLDRLVEEGVIDQDTADDIGEWLDDHAAEFRAEMGERGPRGRGFHGPGGPGIHSQMSELLEDGVIDESELEELGADHPLNDPDGPFADYLDGGLTVEELHEAHEEMRSERGDRPFRFRQFSEDAEASLSV